MTKDSWKKRVGDGQTRSSAGFTLLELMAVMFIMFILMGMATVSFRGLIRGAGFSGALNNVTGVLRQSRQYSIMRGVPTRVVLGSTSMDIYQINLTTNHLVAETRYLPSGVQFSGSPGPVDFNPDGTPGNSAGYQITVEEVNIANPQSTNIVVDGVTGWIE